MFGLKSDEEKLFESIDKIDAQVAKLRETGHPDMMMMESIAKNRREIAFAYKGMMAKTMAAVAQSHNRAVHKKWSRMWLGIQNGSVHPR
jgi:hypothetical protein